MIDDITCIVIFLYVDGIKKVKKVEEYQWYNRDYIKLIKNNKIFNKIFQTFILYLVKKK